MTNTEITKADGCLLDQTARNSARNIPRRLEKLLRKGESIDIDDCESVQAWINATFDELKSFPSEHLTFRLQCLHTGLGLLSIALEKEEEMEQAAVSNEFGVSTS
jgi:hypothetical protein